MKYEYLKGSEKDFEGLPDWATVIVSGTSTGNKFYLEGMMPGLKYGSLLTGFESQICDIHVNSNIIAERRQITEPSWDGIGLPPVGCECEFTLGPYEPDELDDLAVKLPWPGTLVTVVSHMVTGDGNDVAVIYWDENGGGRAACLVGSCLKPTISEVDKKRDAVTSSILSALVEMPWHNEEMAKQLYSAIAAGKILGVKLED